MKRIAIFVSGEGTNAEAIARYFAGSDSVEVALCVSNRAAAGAIRRMEGLGIPVSVYPKPEWQPAATGGCDGSHVLAQLRELSIDMVVLAGFLAMVPQPLLDAYQGRIVNIHPSLLPRHGGRGTWGQHVHQSVLDAGDKESGITIHQVTSEVDGGEIIFQARCAVEPGDTLDTLAQRVHRLEHEHYPRVIERLLM